MAVDKQPLTAARQQADSATWAADQQQATHQQTAAAPDAATPDSLGAKCMRMMAHKLHYVTFLPLILISVLQSINILVAAIVSTAIVCLLLLLSFWCYKAGHVKVRCVDLTGCWVCIFVGLSTCPAVASGVQPAACLLQTIAQSPRKPVN